MKEHFLTTRPPWSGQSSTVLLFIGSVLFIRGLRELRSQSRSEEGHFNASARFFIFTVLVGSVASIGLGFWLAVKFSALPLWMAFAILGASLVVTLIWGEISNANQNMNLEDMARAYVACVELADRIQTEAPALDGEVGELRSDLHALLMSALRERGIPFTDRAEAAQIVFQMTKTATIPR